MKGGSKIELSAIYGCKVVVTYWICNHIPNAVGAVNSITGSQQHCGPLICLFNLAGHLRSLYTNNGYDKIQ